MKFQPTYKEFLDRSKFMLKYTPAHDQYEQNYWKTEISRLQRLLLVLAEQQQ